MLVRGQAVRYFLRVFDPSSKSEISVLPQGEDNFEFSRRSFADAQDDVLFLENKTLGLIDEGGGFYFKNLSDYLL